MDIQLKRIYDGVGATDGYRVLVDRLWPRGVAKNDAALDEWARELAPSTDLRRWFAHDRSRWPAFCEAYRSELQACDPQRIRAVRERAEQTGLTLVYAARDRECNHAVVLKRFLEEPR